jgi:hypothetical protein
MSNVSAIRAVVREPCEMTAAAGETEGAAVGDADADGAAEPVGATVGVDVGGGGLGEGGFVSSTVMPGMRTRCQPGLIEFGS